MGDPIIISAVIGGCTTLIVSLLGFIMAKVNVVHQLANSNLAAANARLDQALLKIEGLKAMILEMQTPTTKE